MKTYIWNEKTVLVVTPEKKQQKGKSRQRENQHFVKRQINEMLILDYSKSTFVPKGGTLSDGRWKEDGS